MVTPTLSEIVRMMDWDYWDVFIRVLILVAIVTLQTIIVLSIGHLLGRKRFIKRELPALHQHKLGIAQAKEKETSLLNKTYEKNISDLRAELDNVNADYRGYVSRVKALGNNEGG